MADKDAHARDEDSEVDSLHCSNCGAQLHITSADDDFVTCDYCGSTYSVAELLGGDAKPVVRTSHSRGSRSRNSRGRISRSRRLLPPRKLPQRQRG